MFECLSTRFNTSKVFFWGHEEFCENKLMTFCVQLAEAVCSEDETLAGRRKRQTDPSEFGEESPPARASNLDYIFNPNYTEARNVQLDQARSQYKQVFRKLDLNQSYSGLFQLLWYSHLPCFDIKEISILSKEFGEEFEGSALLKECRWKGNNIPCSAIFKTFPTDRGMCCTFNMQAVENMFKNGTYSAHVKKMQDKDFAEAEEGPVAVPSDFASKKEPSPQPGMTKGLQVKGFE